MPKNLGLRLPHPSKERQEVGQLPLVEVGQEPDVAPSGHDHLPRHRAGDVLMDVEASRLQHRAARHGPPSRHDPAARAALHRRAVPSGPRESIEPASSGVKRPQPAPT